MGIIASYLWDVYKLEILVFSSNRLEEGRGKGAGWAFLLDMGMEEGGYRRVNTRNGLKIIKDESENMECA